jgi:ADP-ribose pyrophosphatase
LLEIVAGRLEPGEEPADAARRELIEEVGLRAGRLEPLGRFMTSPGFATEVMHAFYATDLETVGASPDHDEFIEIERRPLGGPEAIDAILDDLDDAKSIAAVALAHRRGLLGG